MPKTWNLLANQIYGLMDYILHEIASNQIEQIQILMRIWKKTPNLCS